MTALRLLRRLLLCSLVAAIAFAATVFARWPRPLWTVHFENLAELQLLASPIPADDREIWLRTAAISLDAIHPSDQHFECRDAATGALLNRVAHDNRVVANRGGGELVLVRSANNDDDGPLTVFDVYTPRSDQPAWSVSFEKDWEPSRDGRRAWRTTRGRDRVTVEIADIAPGAQPQTFHFPAPPKDDERAFDFSVSPDGLRFVIQELDHDDGSPRGLYLYSLDDGEQLARILPPEMPSLWKSGRVSDPSFSEDGRLVQLYWHSDGTWGRGAPDGRRIYYQVQTGAYVEVPTPPLSPPPIPADFDELNGMIDVWFAFAKADMAPWFSVQRDGRVVAPWRKYPFAMHFPRGTQPTPRESFDLIAVPGRHELVCVTAEPSPQTLLPDAIQRLIPADWKQSAVVRAARWHDWETNEWRYLSSFPRSFSIQLHRDGLLIRDRPGPDEFLLQSWPLPPPELQRPASLAASSTFALTWFLLARRARRRPLQTPMP